MGVCVLAAAVSILGGPLVSRDARSWISNVTAGRVELAGRLELKGNARLRYGMRISAEHLEVPGGLNSISCRYYVLCCNYCWGRSFEGAIVPARRREQVGANVLE